MKKERRNPVTLQGHATHLNGMDHICKYEDKKGRIEVKILKGLKASFMSLFSISD